ncbi:hypothetical protein ACHHYP_04954 [Achlya hypogyna]|uniref:Uncharacterized protein n=1 Tax=Achlya hypogyna TaxID=1202772 RepID=A0A1V9YZG5_ACHHY|nr:hypothetical protein ACHHYP_04954 [Achlya hypogyna]
MSCFFNACLNPSVTGSTKCHFHRQRRQCEEAGCRNQVFARNRCVRHGGKRQCSEALCTANARVGGRCSRHGPTPEKPRCVVDACENVAQRHRRCIRHGGGRPCHFAGCKTHARSSGYCLRHLPATPYTLPLSAGTGIAIKEERIDAAILDAVLSTDDVAPMAQLTTNLDPLPDW